MKTNVLDFLRRSPFTVLCLMTLSFVGFGYFSVNLFFMFEANLTFIKSYGVMALQEGAAIQLLWLLLNAFISVLFYSFWKVGERLLVDYFTAVKKVKRKSKQQKNAQKNSESNNKKNNDKSNEKSNEENNEESNGKIVNE